VFNLNDKNFFLLFGVYIILCAMHNKNLSLKQGSRVQVTYRRTHF
jgi:hypothetical protein